MKTEKQREIRFLQRESALLRAVSKLIVQLNKEIKSLLKISITEVKLSKDLSIAKIFLYSSFGKEAVEEAIKDLIPYLPSIKNSLPVLTELRRVPNLRLVYDEQRDKINHIESILDSVKN